MRGHKAWERARGSKRTEEVDQRQQSSSILRPRSRRLEVGIVTPAAGLEPVMTRRRKMQGSNLWTGGDYGEVIISQSPFYPCTGLP